jgi:hypothetical protein
MFKNKKSMAIVAGLFVFGLSSILSSMQNKVEQFSDFMLCCDGDNRPDGYVMPETREYEKLTLRDAWISLMYKGVQKGYAVYEYPYLEKRSVYPPEILTDNACLKRVFIGQEFCSNKELCVWFRNSVMQQMRDRGCQEIIIRD